MLRSNNSAVTSLKYEDSTMREREKERKRDRQTERGDTERVKSIFGDLKVNIILTFFHLFLFLGVGAHLG